MRGADANPNESPAPIPRRGWRPRLTTVVAVAAATVVAAVAAMLSIPLVLERTHLSPDVANYLAVANAFAHGSGFVEPIQWHFYLPGSPPQPAWAFLSPLICLALTVPILLGADVTGAIAFHAALASCIGGAMVLVARRFMSLPAAMAAGVALAWSMRWAQVSYFALTEPYAVLGVLLMIATAPGIRSSYRGALLCAAATIFGWLARANVPLLAIAIVVALLWDSELPLRRAVRDRLLWTYVGAVVGGMLALRVVYQLATGLPPYANYDAFFEMFESWDLVHVDKQYVGTCAFMMANWDMVTARWWSFGKELCEELFELFSSHYAGFMLPIVVTWGIFGRTRTRADVQRRIAALGACGFFTATILTYGGFEPRYALLGVSCVWLATLCSLDQIITRFAGRHAPVSRLGLLALVLAVFSLVTLPYQGERARRLYASYEARGATRVIFDAAADKHLRKLCRSVSPDYVAVAKTAEALHFWCGNPTLRLPLDVGQGDALARFLHERNVRYVIVAMKDRQYKFTNHSPLLRRIKATAEYTLYEVGAFHGPPAWKSPPALACLDNRAPLCPRR